MKPSSDKNRNEINTKNYNDNGNNSNSSSNLYTSSQTNNVKIPASAWKVLALLSCIATMVMYAETMLIPAIPDLIKTFMYPTVCLPGSLQHILLQVLL